MPAAVLSSHRHAPKNTTLKWTMPQSVNTVKQGRIHKRTGSSGSQHTIATKKSVTSSPANKVEKLESELISTFETVANITVMLESLRNAYATCKSEIGQSKYATRLSEKEKELLAAYDDLNLQVTHLERRINKFETHLGDLKTLKPELQQQVLPPPPPPPSPPPPRQPQQPQQPPQAAASPVSVDSTVGTMTPHLSYPQNDISTTATFITNYLFDDRSSFSYDLPQCQPCYQQQPHDAFYYSEQSFSPYIDINTVPHASAYPVSACDYSYASSAINVQYPFYVSS